MDYKTLWKQHEDFLKTEKDSKTEKVYKRDTYDFIVKGDLEKTLIETFGNEKSAREWFHNRNRYLGQTPYESILKNEGNSEEVIDELKRIMYGVY
jgi:hypothetical protein